ncbi:low affinity immunoglobulin gamma Fc region receptor II-like [Monodelphis domestica]|uniref:Low affinity immunoglobulin gamma Fc region receptor II-like n=1 Tax=Monodelphis domestica TaxID=13616 RepID=A0A5F8H4G4_MONDO|nr:low affinity immunoglobulin gamma Fc region receptor II-like [Monodelphis domestica]
MGESWVPQPVTTFSSVLLWAGLLCLAPAVKSNGPPKALLTLEPPWVNVLREDNVTLKCEGLQTPGHDSTEWFHNGSPISINQESYTIPALNLKDSGEYQCRTEQTSLSNPVRLQVTSDWLLLQVESLVFMEGDSTMLRCHSWKSKPLYKVTYYHNDKALKYGYHYFDYIIPQVNLTHSGSYYCAGQMGRVLHTSKSVMITVQEGNRHIIRGLTIILAQVVVIALIAAVAVYYYKRHRKTVSISEEIKKKEVENPVSYSLLKYTDTYKEEECGCPSYQNHL